MKAKKEERKKMMELALRFRADEWGTDNPLLIPNVEGGYDWNVTQTPPLIGIRTKVEYNIIMDMERIKSHSQRMLMALQGGMI